jgi:hypothetical protein
MNARQKTIQSARNDIAWTEKNGKELFFGDSGTEVCLIGANRKPENTNKLSSRATNKA